jgi:peptidoglycan/xylan/chitin deacetylase (PgdA/CDA1 family)
VSFAGGWAARKVRDVPRVPPPLILAYHGVSDVPAHQDPEGLFISPRQLRGQIDRLRRWGYAFVTFGEMAERVAAGRGAGHVALTFDDGLLDNLEQLVPILHDERIPATTFVTTAWMGAPHPSVPYARNMTPDEVRELHRSGVEIGGHTVSHPDLTTLSFDAVRDEVRTGCAQLAEIVGAPVDTFAYPFGFASPETIRATGTAGVRAACRVAAEGHWDEPLNLPRQDTNTKSALGLWLKRDDRYERLMRHKPAKLVRRLGKERRKLVSRLRAR